MQPGSAMAPSSEYDGIVHPVIQAFFKTETGKYTYEPSRISLYTGLKEETFSLRFRVRHHL